MDEKRCFCPEQRTSSKKLHFIGSAMGCFMSVLLPGPISPDICVLQPGLRGGGWDWVAETLGGRWKIEMHSVHRLCMVAKLLFMESV